MAVFYVQLHSTWCFTLSYSKILKDVKSKNENSHLDILQIQPRVKVDVQQEMGSWDV